MRLKWKWNLDRKLYIIYNKWNSNSQTWSIGPKMLKTKMYNEKIYKPLLTKVIRFLQMFKISMTFELDWWVGSKIDWGIDPENNIKLVG